MIRADRRDVDIVVAVVVVVAHGAAQSVHLYRQARLLGHIGKRAVVIVVIERRKRLAGLMARPVHGVDQQNVLPAIVVVVEKADAAAHRFRQVFFPEGAVVVFEVNARLRRSRR